MLYYLLNAFSESTHFFLQFIFHLSFKYSSYIYLFRILWIIFIISSQHGMHFSKNMCSVVFLFCLNMLLSRANFRSNAIFKQLSKVFNFLIGSIFTREERFWDVCYVSAKCEVFSG